MPVFSIVICTYNRCDLLPLAVESVCAQTLGKELIETIIVDNRSTDATHEVSEQLIGNHGGHAIRYVFESQPGLGHARNRGLAESRGRYIVYLDDDAIASNDYLELALQDFESVAREAVCVGGKILPFYTTQKPAWFLDELEIHSHGEEARWLRKGESLSGSNMIWARQGLLDAGGFGGSHGMMGDKMGTAEETNVFLRLWESGKGRFWYNPCLQVQHWVNPIRMDVGYFYRRAWTNGQGNPEPFRIGRAIRLTWQGMLDVANSIRLALWHWSDRLTESPEVWKIKYLTGVCIGLGRIFAGWNIYIRPRQRKSKPAAATLPVATPSQT